MTLRSTGFEEEQSSLRKLRKSLSQREQPEQRPYSIYVTDVKKKNENHRGRTAFIRSPFAVKGRGDRINICISHVCIRELQVDVVRLRKVDTRGQGDRVHVPRSCFMEHLFIPG